MDDNNISKWFLKKSTFPQFMLLILSGTRLKILANRTKRDILLIIRKQIVAVDNLKRNIVS